MLRGIMDIYVPGFMASGIGSGLKGKDKKDLALIYSNKPAVAAGVFTKNSIKAASVLLTMERIREGRGQAIIINSGNANACTGERGYRDALRITELIAKELHIKERDVFICSTGVIGRPLDMKVIEGKIPELVKALSEKGIPSAAEAIMTTDSFPKISMIKERIGGKEITICGIAKGAGMIMPNMATMLAFILTDLAVEKETLKGIFKSVVRDTFNRISVDGTTSTNDTAIIMANGEAGNEVIDLYSERKKRAAFKEALFHILDELSKKIVRDGEGATKFIEIVVRGAPDRRIAKRLAYDIANSILVKTAFFGGDPNWGRIMAVLGSSKLNLSMDRVDIYFNGILAVKDGVYSGIEENRIKEVLRKDSFKVIIDLKQGRGEYSVYTTDLSYEYVKINSEYTT